MIDPATLRDLYDERAAIYEFEGKKSRDQAEYLAMMDVRKACGDRETANRIYQERKTR